MKCPVSAPKVRSPICSDVSPFASDFAHSDLASSSRQPAQMASLLPVLGRHGGSVELWTMQIGIRWGPPCYVWWLWTHERNIVVIVINLDVCSRNRNQHKQETIVIINHSYCSYVAPNLTIVNAGLTLASPCKNLNGRSCSEQGVFIFPILYGESRIYELSFLTILK